jgi:WD40 repeat protein
VYQLDDIGGFTVSAAFSPDGKRVMTVTDHLICLWDAATGQRLLNLKREDYYGREIGSAVFSPGGESVLVAETSGFIWIYNAETGEPVHIIPPPCGRQ